MLQCLVSSSSIIGNSSCGCAFCEDGRMAAEGPTYLAPPGSSSKRCSFYKHVSTCILCDVLVALSPEGGKIGKPVLHLCCMARVLAIYCCNYPHAQGYSCDLYTTTLDQSSATPAKSKTLCPD